MRLKLTVILVSSLILISSYAFSDSQFFSLEGVWQFEGYGVILDIKEEENKRYSYRQYDINSYSCLEVDDGILPRDQDGYTLFEGMKILAGENDGLIVKHNLAYEIALKKLNNLPKLCDEPVQKLNNPVDNFEVFWHGFNDYYAFFELYNVDWQKQYEKYRMQVDDNTTDTELFEILSNMLEPLQDGHIGLIADDLDMEYSPEQYPNWVEDADSVINLLISKYLKTEPRLLAEESFAISQLSDDIAYLNILKMYGFDPSVSSDNENVDWNKDHLAVTKAMDKIIKELLDPDNAFKALVIDIRFNSGGEDTNSAIIARYFADKKRKVYSKTYWNGNSFAAEQDIYISPRAGARFNKPIILITSGVTASAAEIFTLMMRTLPHVTVIGEASNGAFSDILPHVLPNGWEFGLSNERYTAADGNNYERFGIPPNELILIDLDDIHADRDLAIDRALEILEQY